ncbi:MAG TPA: hypothetical protein VFB58_12880 [Chloroflexota bacterium]|nr:hypothetical protein [Chloroflexota bacterium]
MPKIVRVIAVTFVLLAVPRAVSASHAPSDLFLLHRAAGLAAHESVHRVAAWLRHQPGVARAGIGRDHRTIDIHFTDGREMLVLPAALHATRLAPVARRLHAALRPLARLADPTPQAAVLEPFAAELGAGNHVGDVEVQDLQSAGFQVTQAYNSAVTVELMTTLPRYQVVYMNTHTGTSANGDGVVATDELVYGNNDPSLLPYLNDGSIVPVGVAGDVTDAFYAITARFVSLHMGQFSHDSLIFVNGCALLPATAFWGALASKGAGVLISWSGDVAEYDDYLSAAALFNQMDSGASVQGAINTLLANGYGRSSSGGTTSTIGFEGDGTITLARAAAGTPVTTPSPTATPLPTATPSPTGTTVPTPTPRPTATASPTVSPPPVSLHVTAAHAQVKPGQTQSITVQGPAGVTVPVQIHYPNGVVQSLSSALSSSGSGTIAYRQPGSEISRRGRRVTVTASLGGVSARTTYALRYGHVDLAVPPLHAGKSLSLAVHSAARSQVTVTIMQGGHIRTMHVTTAANGWGTLHVRLRSAGTAVFRATVRLHGRLYRTSLSLPVA